MVHTNNVGNPHWVPDNPSFDLGTAQFCTNEDDILNDLPTFESQDFEDVTRNTRTIYISNEDNIAFVSVCITNIQDMKMVVRPVQRDGSPLPGNNSKKLFFVHCFPIEAVAAIKDRDTEHDNTYRGLKHLSVIRKRLKGSEYLHCVMKVNTVRCNGNLLVFTDYLFNGTLQDRFGGTTLPYLDCEGIDTINYVVSCMSEELRMKIARRVFGNNRNKLRDDTAGYLYRSFCIPPRQASLPVAQFIRDLWSRFVYFHFGPSKNPGVDQEHNFLCRFFKLTDDPNSDKLHYLLSPEDCAREFRRAFGEFLVCTLSRQEHRDTSVAFYHEINTLEKFNEFLSMVFPEDIIAKKIVCIRGNFFERFVRQNSFTEDEWGDLDCHLPPDVIESYLEVVTEGKRTELPLNNSTDLDRFSICLIETVAAIHNMGYAHLDLSPGNIGIESDSTPVITDLNASKRMQPVDVNQRDTIGSDTPFQWQPFPPTDEPFGTGRYMCPSYSQGGANMGVQRDMCALGMILGELIVFHACDYDTTSYQKIVHTLYQAFRKCAGHNYSSEMLLYRDFLLRVLKGELEQIYSATDAQAQQDIPVVLACRELDENFYARIEEYSSWIGIVERLLQQNPLQRPRSLNDILPELRRRL